MIRLRHAIAFAALCAFAPVFAKPAWRPIAKTELAERASVLEPGAPAEALLMEYEIDDSNFPESRQVTEYLRYKIYDPERATRFTRKLLIESSESSSHVEIAARLTLPDGTTREFGRDAIKEQVLAQRAGERGLLQALFFPAAEVRERLLVIAGVEPGAIIDYVITRRLDEPGAVHTIRPQSVAAPVRQFRFVCHDVERGDWRHRIYGFNLRGARFERNEGRGLVTLSATNLPSLHLEPLAGPPTDYAFAIMSCYEPLERMVPLRGGGEDPLTVDEKLGPWATHAAFLAAFSADRAQVTPRVRALASEITAKAGDDESRARAIHAYVTTLSQKYRRRPGPHPKATVQAASLDEVLDSETKPTVKRPPEEFLWLALGLYRAAGFECHAIMLPDRTRVRFDPREVGRVFLPDRALAVKVGNAWRFSCPQNTAALPFGLLPWENEGQGALLGRSGTADFMPVPFTPAAASQTDTTCEFTLDANGVLTGTCSTTMTGHAAVSVRSRLRSAGTKDKRLPVIAQLVGPAGTSVTEGKASNVEDAEKPLEIRCAVKLGTPAVVAGDRILTPVAPRHTGSVSPFAAAQREFPVQFPYAWRDVETVTIRVPNGFEPDGLPPSTAVDGQVRYHLAVRYDAAGRALVVRREFESQLSDVAAADYARLKAIFDRVAEADRGQITLRRVAGTSVPSP